MSEIILYSTGCIQCLMIEKKMKEKEIDFQVDSNKNTMAKLGINKVPVLRIDDVLITDILTINKTINNWEK